MESYSAARFASLGLDLAFVQDNQSFSVAKGVLRGLHYQLPPHAQDKLVRVLRGAIFDVAVDIRKSSATLGKWVGLELSAKSANQMLIPKGFAHGFLTLEPETEVLYKVTDVYAPTADRSIRFDDPTVAIQWPHIEAIQLSEKDQAAPYLAAAEIFA
ncbi:dTDP-4-dehydrorhamnose 3,5-epimerase [Variibacter gotjawalensis]|uniref:dTDP-4-dehydrorhamnose 3,5-epimerase n=2 Tax=Variibacter gotjawalensis TaxID=1333996 RepID=A0A0S3PP93_9BRAD|nr:dTDP-4-dehydrorhamnose 3,5-epimerase [Variibacter gotjawalensis]